jgi:hypothetical protein
LGGRTNPGQNDLRAERNQFSGVLVEARGIAGCARATSGHAAAPPTSVMNWRRL